MTGPNMGESPEAKELAAGTPVPSAPAEAVPSPGAEHSESRDVMRSLVASGSSLEEAAEMVRDSFGREAALDALSEFVGPVPFQALRVVAKLLADVIAPYDVWTPAFAKMKAEGREPYRLMTHHYDLIPSDRRPERFHKTIMDMGINPTSLAFGALVTKVGNGLNLDCFMDRLGVEQFVRDSLEGGEGLFGNTLNFNEDGRRPKTLGGSGWIIPGHMDLTDCKKLESLPEKLTIEYNLNLTGCESLDALPAGLWVGGDLTLEGCVNWDRRIPDDAVIGGRIYTDEFPKLKNEGGRTGGGLTLDDIRKWNGVVVNIYHFSAELSALVASGMPWREAIRVVYPSCPSEGAVRGLVERMKDAEMGWPEIGEALGPYLMGAPADIALSVAVANLIEDGKNGVTGRTAKWFAAHVGGFPSAVMNAFKGMVVNNADFSGTEIETLPEGLNCPIDLCLEGCANLRKLPYGLAVGRDLKIADCPSWDGKLPPGTQIGRSIETSWGTFTVDPQQVGIAPDYGLGLIRQSISSAQALAAQRTP